MSAQPFIVATAGHIDHGKSTLIEALSGTNPDRLPEEQKRGMTIELGFAHLALTDPEDPERQYELGLIDVPGHADFVKNMVAGVGGIDLALLVVAADDGWMPQTEEHFQILLYLGITRMVVALTKSDVMEDRDLVMDEIREHLLDTPMEDAPVVPVCALSGEGLDDVRAALAHTLRDTPPPIDIGKPRLFVDRAFSPKGAGTVVTGTLAGGSLTVGQELILQPVGIHTRIRGLQNHNHAAQTSPPGTRTAVQIHDVPIATDDHQAANTREMVKAGGARMIRQPPETIKDPRPMGQDGNDLMRKQGDIFAKLAKDLSRQIQAIAQSPASLANAAHGAWNCGRPNAAKDLADLVEGMGGIDLMDVIRVGETAPRAAVTATKAQTAHCEPHEDIAA